LLCDSINFDLITLAMAYCYHELCSKGILSYSERLSILMTQEHQQFVVCLPFSKQHILVFTLQAFDLIRENVLPMKEMLA
jgi:hypothetical protein